MKLKFEQLEKENQILRAQLALAKKTLETIAIYCGPHNGMEMGQTKALAKINIKPTTIMTLYSCRAVKDEPLDRWSIYKSDHDGGKYCEDVEGTLFIWPKVIENE